MSKKRKDIVPTRWTGDPLTINPTKRKSRTLRHRHQDDGPFRASLTQMVRIPKQ